MKIKRDVNYILLLLTGLIFSACRQTPISESDLSSILADIYILDNSVAQNGIMEKNMADTTLIFKPVLEKYGYDLEDFKYSFDYYLEEEERLYKIYDAARLKISEITNHWDKVRDNELMAEARVNEIEYYSNLPDSILNLNYAIKSLQWQLKPDTSFVFFADTINYTPYTAKWWDSVAVEIMVNDWNKIYRPYVKKDCCDCYECTCPEKCDTLEISCGCCEACDEFHARIKEKKEQEKEEQERIEKERKEKERIEQERIKERQERFKKKWPSPAERREKQIQETQKREMEKRRNKSLNQHLKKSTSTKKSTPIKTTRPGKKTDAVNQVNPVQNIAKI